MVNTSASAQWLRNKNRITVLVLLFAIISFCGVLVWAGIPALNTIYIRAGPDGTMLDFRFRLSWFLVMLFPLNILPPLLALFVIMNPKNNTRADLYFVFTTIVLIANVLMFAAFAFYWLGWTNTVNTGKEPFNDYHWCCAYHSQRPELCPNTMDCTPNVVPADLTVNGTFVTHWVFVGVYLIFGLWHWALQRLLRINGVVRKNDESEESGKGLATLILCINLGFLLYWAGVPLLNSLYVTGYPLIGIPPGPGDPQSTLYSFEWWMVFLLSFNILPIMLFFLALIASKNFFNPWLHYWVTVIVMVMTIIAGASFFVIWIADCNKPWSGRALCNDYRWCCKFFPQDMEICPNVMPCPDVDTLSINGDYLQHLIFAVLFVVFGVIQLWLNKRMKRYGVFPSTS